MFTTGKTVGLGEWIIAVRLECYTVVLAVAGLLAPKPGHLFREKQENIYLNTFKTDHVYSYINFLQYVPSTHNRKFPITVG